MYKLMVVTDSSAIKDYMLDYDSWMLNGFKAPHFRTSKDTLIEGLQKHHADAIAVELQDSVEKQKVYEFLFLNYPLIPIFKISMDAAYQAIIFERLRKSLDKINGDYTDDNFTYDQKFDAVRHRWLSKYLRGILTDYKEFEEKNQIFRANLCLTSPCILAELIIPGRDEYLLSEWRYGAERLEVALRNFFNPSVFLPNLNLAVTDNGVCRLLLSNKCYVKDGNGVEISDFVDFLKQTIEEIKSYLSLDIAIDNIINFSNHAECFAYLNSH